MERTLAKRTLRDQRGLALEDRKKKPRRSPELTPGSERDKSINTFFSSLNDGEKKRQQRDEDEERGAVIKAEGERKESFSRANEVDARVHRETLGKGLEVLRDHTLSKKVKRVVLRSLGLDELDRKSVV